MIILQRVHHFHPLVLCPISFKALLDILLGNHPLTLALLSSKLHLHELPTAMVVVVVIVVVIASSQHEGGGQILPSNSLSFKPVLFSLEKKPVILLVIYLKKHVMVTNN